MRLKVLFIYLVYLCEAENTFKFAHHYWWWGLQLFSSFELKFQRTDKPHCVYIVYIYCISFALLLIPTVAKWSEAQFNFCTAKPILCTSFKTYCMLCFVDPLLHRSATGYNDQIFTFVLSNTMPHQPQNNVCAFVEVWKQLETWKYFIHLHSHYYTAMARSGH